VLSSLAGAHVKAVIGGEGADELFGGYELFRRPYPYWLRGLTPRPLGDVVARHAPDHRVRRWMRIAGAPTPGAADAEWRRILLPGEKRDILKPELRCAGPDLAPTLIPPELAATCRDGMQRRLAYEIRGRLSDAILISHDKLAMAHSLEVRVPFLDRGVVELAERLPSRLKMHRGREKIVVGRLARRLLPPDIAARRKQGLAYPRANWVRSPAADRLRQFLLDGADRGPFLRRPLERLLERRARMLGPHQSLATLVMVQAWWDEFF
jgi:asparagine synthase (glutamine-hydrolysing)